MNMADKHTIAVVSACMKKDGTPAFALNTVEVTHEEEANGIHYYLAEGQLLEDGFEEPFVHFGEDEAPAFLFPAIRQHLGLTSNGIHHPEESACPASSS
jgi:hypothetical protein